MYICGPRGGIDMEGGYICIYGGGGDYLAILYGSLSLRPADRPGQSREGNLHGAMTKDRSVYICVCSIAANCVVVMGGVAVRGGAWRCGMWCGGAGVWRCVVGAGCG